TWHFPDEPPPAPARRYSRREVVSAWVPWLLLTVFVFAWGLPEVKAVLGKASVKVEVPELHKRVQRTAPVVEKAKPEDAVFDFNWLSATGTGILLAALLSAVWLRVPPWRVVRIFA